MTWTNWEKVEGDKLDFTDIIYEKKHHVKYEGGIARILVNRPEVYNALNQNAMDEMFRAFYDAGHDPMIGVIVLGGVGDHFGTGGDVIYEQWGLRQMIYWQYPSNRALRTSKKPVIAAVNGFCIGGSHHLAYMCDFTIAADNAIFGQNGPRVSSPADGFIVSYLVRVVGAKKAREMWMLCRRYTASEALDMGLCNKVVPLAKLEDEVDQWCEELLAMSPSCLEILKASFDWEIDSMPNLGSISSWLHPDFLETAEGKEGSAAFIEKRAPRFWQIRKVEAEARRKSSELLSKE